MKKILGGLSGIILAVVATPALAFDPFNSAAMKKISFSGERLDLNGPLPRIVFEAKNNSGQDFSMIFVECHARAKGKVVANADGMIGSLADGDTSVTDAMFMGSSSELLAADEAKCRASGGIPTEN